MNLCCIRRSYRFFLLLSLGAEEPIVNQRSPQQQIDQQQQGKQFDHGLSYILKSNTLFTLVCMHCYLVLNYD